MFYVHFYTIFSIFGNKPINKMPQCQFMFSAVFVFQKSCTGNILGIAWDKLPVLLNHVTKTMPEGDLRGLPGGHTPPRRGQTLARAWVASGPTRAPPTPPLRLFINRFGKTIDTREKIHEKFRSRRHRRTHLGRVLELFSALCRRDKSPPEAFFIAMLASAMMCE